MSLGVHFGAGPAGMAPMKLKSGVVAWGVALNVPGEPLLGMPTQPATDATTAISTHARRARASHRRPVPARSPHPRAHSP